MKKIINGKKYDTETAKFIDDFSNNLSIDDFKYFYEGLYKKRTGEFFLEFEGGALSKYSQWSGNGYCGGSGIVPLSLDEAKKWVENHLSVSDYEDVFGEVEE